MAINRIILRAVEIIAHEAIQKQCKNMLKTSSRAQAHDLTALLQNLGKIANTLRLRIAWCDVHEQSSTGNAEILAAKMRELKKVTRIIYFWYVTAWKKRQKDPSMNFHDQQNHLSVGEILVPDPFPDPDSDESDESFKSWLSHGQAVLAAAGLSEQPTHTYPSFTQYFPDDQVPSSLIRSPFQSQVAPSNAPFSFF